MLSQALGSRGIIVRTTNKESLTAQSGQRLLGSGAPASVATSCPSAARVFPHSHSCSFSKHFCFLLLSPPDPVFSVPLSLSLCLSVCVSSSGCVSAWQASEPSMLRSRVAAHCVCPHSAPSRSNSSFSDIPKLKTCSTFMHMHTHTHTHTHTDSLS